MQSNRWDIAVLRESPWYEEIRQEGIQLGKQEAVPILTELGLPADEIAQRLDLPPERVNQILGQ